MSDRIKFGIGVALWLGGLFVPAWAAFPVSVLGSFMAVWYGTNLLRHRMARKQVDREFLEMWGNH